MTREFEPPQPDSPPLEATDRQIRATLELGFTALQAADFAQAYEAGATVLHFRPKHFDALFLLGVIAAQRGDFRNAVNILGEAIAAEPSHPNRATVYNNIGIAFTGLRMWPDAIESYKKAIAIAPDNAEIYFNLGNAWRHLGNNANAVENYDKAVLYNPAHFEAYYNRAMALRDLQHYEAAIESCQKAIALNPNDNPLFGFMFFTKMVICDWSDYENQLVKLNALIAAGKKVANPFTVVSFVESAALQRAAAETWAASECQVTEDLGPIAAWTHDKIRVGYFSTDFRDHPATYLLAGVIETHDRAKFETYAFSLGPNTQDRSRRRMEKAFDYFLDVREKSDREIAELARSLEIDVAVDVTGYAAGERPKIFVMRAAPAQISFSFPGTMALKNMDYMIADKTLVPPSNHAFYSETMIYLPSFQPNDSKRKIAERTPSRDELGLPRSGVVFCCFNHLYKIAPAVFDIWMRILKRVKGSILWLPDSNPSAKRNLQAEATRRGVDAARFIFGYAALQCSSHRQRRALGWTSCTYMAHGDVVWTRCREPFDGARFTRADRALRRSIRRLGSRTGEQSRSLGADPRKAPAQSANQLLVQHRTVRPQYRSGLYSDSRAGARRLTAGSYRDYATTHTPISY